MSSILRSRETRFTHGRLFCALGPLFGALVRGEAIFDVCKRCANEGFACMCKEKISFLANVVEFNESLAYLHQCFFSSIRKSELRRFS